MRSDKAEKRRLREAELSKLTIDRLADIAPYEKGRVVASQTDPGPPKKLSKKAMIEAILRQEGLGVSR